MYVTGFGILMLCYFNEFMQTYVKFDCFKVLLFYIYIGLISKLALIEKISLILALVL